MAKKVNYTNIGFQMGLGAVFYFAFLKPKKAIVKTPVLTVGDVTGDGFLYEPIYFKEKEYFSNYPIPEKYLPNWSKLSRILDEIRIAFGSAIIISRGFENSIGDVVTNKYQNCLAVDIFPQNKLYAELHEIIKAMILSKQIVLDSYIKLSNGAIKIVLNG